MTKRWIEKDIVNCPICSLLLKTSDPVLSEKTYEHIRLHLIKTGQKLILEPYDSFRRLNSYATR